MNYSGIKVTVAVCIIGICSSLIDTTTSNAIIFTCFGLIVVLGLFIIYCAINEANNHEGDN